VSPKGPVAREGKLASPAQRRPDTASGANGDLGAGSSPSSDYRDSTAEIIRGLLIFVGAMFLVLVVPIVVVANMPGRQPVAANACRTGAPRGGDMTRRCDRLPFDGHEPVGGVCDVGTLLLLASHWPTYSPIGPHTYVTTGCGRQDAFGS
jgi:hypothetical protein